jgi:DNA-binding LacI/PurR family transcriptional regulator
MDVPVTRSPLGVDPDPGVRHPRPGQRPRGAAALLDRAPDLTAILATTDLLAQGAIQAARERDLPVPAAVSVVGFDDLPPPPAPT